MELFFGCQCVDSILDETCVVSHSASWCLVLLSLPGFIISTSRMLIKLDYIISVFVHVEKQQIAHTNLELFLR